jgi:hypothetical protein
MTSPTSKLDKTAFRTSESPALRTDQDNTPSEIKAAPNNCPMYLKDKSASTPYTESTSAGAKTNPIPNIMDTTA